MNVPARKPAPPSPPQTTAIAKVSEMPDWLSEAVQKYAQNPNFDLLLPAIPVSSQLGWGYQPSVSVVTLSPDPNAGDVFKVGKKNGADVFAYSKQALEKLASAAGISLRMVRVDDRSDRDYCEVEAIGVMKNESGQEIIRTARKAFHMADVEGASIQEKMKWNQGMTEEAARAAVANEMAGFRKHLLARTESGAANRVIRALLAIGSGLTPAQIAKPKVLVRIDFRPDPGKDADLKRILVDRGMGSSLALYGPPPPALPPASQTRHIGTAEVVPDEDDSPEGEGGGVSAEVVAADQPSGTPVSDAEARFYLAAEAIGLSPKETVDLLAKHGQDFTAATAALSTMANEGRTKDTLF
jgi:hypothetical protein